MLLRKLAACVLASLLLAGVAMATETEEVKVFDVAPGTRVRISNQDGAVRVNVWQQPQVRLIARRKASAMTRNLEQRLFDLMHVRVEKRGPDVFIEGRVESISAFGWLSYSLELDVTVPRKTDLQVRGRDGSIILQGVEGSQEIRGRDGSIRAQDLSGDIILSTEDGSLELSDVNGRVRAETADGSIRYRGRPERLELRTADGSISAEILPGARMAANWTLRTADGSINIFLPRDFDANLDADTHDGRVLVNCPVTESFARAHDRFSGKLNAGGYLLNVRTGDGSIHISSR